MADSKVITLENLEEYNEGLKGQIKEKFATKEDLGKINVRQASYSLPSFDDPTISRRL